MRFHTSALLPLILFAFACSDSSGLSTGGTDLANTPPAPINGSDGDAFAPPTPEGAGPSAGTPPGGSGSEEGNPVAPVPEPGTLLLVGSGLAGLAIAGRRRRRESKAQQVD